MLSCFWLKIQGFFENSEKLVSVRLLVIPDDWSYQTNLTLLVIPVAVWIWQKQVFLRCRRVYVNWQKQVFLRCRLDPTGKRSYQWLFYEKCT